MKPPTNNNTSQSQSIPNERTERNSDPIKKERTDSPPTNYSQTVREPQPIQDTKPWGYSGIDLMNTGAAFWQNYSGEYYTINEINLLKNIFVAVVSWILSFINLKIDSVKLKVNFALYLLWKDS